MVDPAAASAPLPDRTPEAEDAFVDAWSRADDTATLVATITAAMDARRPQLAARLVGLLDDHVEIPEGSALDRARRAARLLLHHRDLESAALAPYADELAEAWRAARRGRMTRTLRRMRARAQEPAGVLGAVPGGRRKPRLTGRNRRG
ncbi:MAG: hypothetical protein D6798_18640 [Deltaproteobacteria bacterium]|nr:MAG: hypothetical protein D6798_18640 [Deltaproteobacteria bacterium]